MTRSVTRAALSVMALQAVSLCAAQDVQVNMDGQALAFPDTQPQMMYDTVLVPIRPVLERMGGEVHWDDATQTITANVNGKEVELQINGFVATVDGKYQDLQNAPVMVEGRTMIPMRFLADAFGAQLTWSEPDRMLSIDTDGTATAVVTPPATDNIRAVNLYAGDTIPLVLDDPLSSFDSQVGDTFTATVYGLDEYGMIPNGTKVEGRVIDVRPTIEGQPGTLDLAFDRMIFPNGEVLAIDGSPVSLYTDYVPADQSGPYDLTLNPGSTITMRVNRDARIALGE